MTRAKLRRGVRKRKESSEVKERKDRRVPAFSLLTLPPELREGPEPCTHTWGEPVHVSFSRGDHAVLKVCETCHGFVRRCKRCRRFHMVDKGQGGEYVMPGGFPMQPTFQSSTLPLTGRLTGSRGVTSLNGSSEERLLVGDRGQQHDRCRFQIVDSSQRS